MASGMPEREGESGTSARARRPHLSRKPCMASTLDGRMQADWRSTLLEYEA